MTEPITPPEPTPPAAPAAVPGAGATLAVAGAGAGAAAAVVGAEVATAPVPPRRRRRRVALLIFLLVILGLVALFAGWYLVTRKPVSELPVIPPVVTNLLPAYGYSVYNAASPTGVAVTADGSRIYVAQTSGNRTVVVFDAKGNALGELKPPATPVTDHVPVYVAVNPTNGDVYVADRVTAQIYVYSPDGVYRRTFDPGKEMTKKGWLPLGIGFGSDGTMYVSDVGAPQGVHKFSPDGTYAGDIGENFNYPNGVWPDKDGNVYVADSNNGQLRIFAPDGREIGGVQRGVRESDLGLPRGVVVDDQGRVYVVDTSGHTVRMYKAITAGERKLEYLGSFGAQGRTDGAFEFPNGVAVDTRGHVFVTDMANNRVQVWSY
jgi:DNA-binding beta-propeller fold protein YncE